MVTQRPKDLTDNLPLALATIESYLDRRLVGDVTYTGVGQNAIVADLFARFVVIGPHGGIPFRVQYATAGAGQVRDRSYLRTDRKTVYSALTELSAVLGGPEWTVEWETWIDGGGITHITPVLYVGDRVGTPVTPGLAPAATFDAPGCIIAAVMVEDYSSGKGANSVIAYSSATAGTVPTSPAQVAADDGAPHVRSRHSAEHVHHRHRDPDRTRTVGPRNPRARRLSPDDVRRRREGPAARVRLGPG